ncbi:hypothetical protein Tco_0184238 [Tanacetum coccineum]
MGFRSFILGGVDGELNFLPARGASEGQNSLSTKFVNNNAPLIDATTLSSVYLSNVVENVADFDDPSYREDEQTLISPSLSPYPEVSKKFKIISKRKVTFGVTGKVLPLKVQKVTAQASKVAGEASTPLDVDSDSDIHEFPSAKELKDVTDHHWVVAHVTPPSWKQHLREIIIEQLCDIHDRAYMRQAVLDNVLNSRTRELISVLHKAKTSYDTIQARELDKDRAYAELERKCNEALQDLDKNPLVSDMRAEIKDLQGQVDGLYSEYNRLTLEDKKWIDYEQTMSSLRAKIEGIESEKERLKSFRIKLLQEINSLKQDRAAVVSKVIPDASMKLICSNGLGSLIAKLVRSSIIYGRCQAFEEVAAIEEPFILEKMSSYRPSLKEEYDQDGDGLTNASYPFLAEYAANLYASLEQLLSKKPPFLRPTFTGSHSKPLSSKINDTEEEDVSSTNACDLSLSSMVKGKEEVKEQGIDESEMETEVEVEEVIEEEESEFETDEEVEKILEEEKDDKDGENFISSPTKEELTHHEWLLKNPRPPWAKVIFDEEKLGNS